MHYTAFSSTWYFRYFLARFILYTKDIWVLPPFQSYSVLFWRLQPDFIAHDQDYSQWCLVIVHPRLPDCGTNWYPVPTRSHNIVPFDGYCMILYERKVYWVYCLGSPNPQCFRDAFRPAARSSRQALCRSAWCRLLFVCCHRMCCNVLESKTSTEATEPFNPWKPYCRIAWSSVSSSLRLKSSFLRTMACRPSPSISKSVELLNTSRLHLGQG